MELRRVFPMMAQVSFSVPQSGRQLMVPGVVTLDPWLAPFKESLKARYNKAQDWIKKIDETEGGLEKFSRVRQHHATQASTTDQSREPRSLDSTWTRKTILPIGNGRLMLRKHSLLVISVFIL